MITTTRFEILFKKDPIVTVANDERMRFVEYLDRAIEAFGLKPHDYFTAFFLLSRKAEGADADQVLGEIREFWDSIEKQYRNYLITYDITPA